MRLQPQGAGAHNRIDADLAPPPGFIAVAMDLAMVSPAKRDRELIAGLAPERPALSKAQMVGITGLSAADQTGAPGDKFDVLPVTKPARLLQCESGLIDRLGPPPPVWLFWIVAR